MVVVGQAKQISQRLRGNLIEGGFVVRDALRRNVAMQTTVVINRIWHLYFSQLRLSSPP